MALRRDRNYVVTIRATRLIRDVNVWAVYDERWDQAPKAVARVADHQSNAVGLNFGLGDQNATSPVVHVTIEVVFWWDRSAGIIRLWQVGLD